MAQLPCLGLEPQPQTKVPLVTPQGSQHLDQTWTKIPNIFVLNFPLIKQSGVKTQLGLTRLAKPCVLLGLPGLPHYVLPTDVKL